MRVLIVEDEYLIASVLASTVTAAGHTPVESVTSAAKARSACTRGQLPEVAFLDLHLRDGWTGLDVARELSELGIKCWFLTANPGDCRTHSRYALGCIPKPFRFELVLRALTISEAHRRGEPFPDIDPEGMVLYRKQR